MALAALSAACLLSTAALADDRQQYGIDVYGGDFNDVGTATHGAAYESIISKYYTTDPFFESARESARRDKKSAAADVSRIPGPLLARARESPTRPTKGPTVFTARPTEQPPKRMRIPAPLLVGGGAQFSAKKKTRMHVKPPPQPKKLTKVLRPVNRPPRQVFSRLLGENGEAGGATASGAAKASKDFPGDLRGDIPKLPFIEGDGGPDGFGPDPALYAGAGHGAPPSKSYFDIMGDFFDRPEINVAREIAAAAAVSPPALPPPPPPRPHHKSPKSLHSSVFDTNRVERQFREDFGTPTKFDTPKFHPYAEPLAHHNPLDTGPYGPEAVEVFQPRPHKFPTHQSPIRPHGPPTPPLPLHAAPPHPRHPEPEKHFSPDIFAAFDIPKLNVETSGELTSSRPFVMPRPLGLIHDDGEGAFHEKPAKAAVHLPPPHPAFGGVPKEAERFPKPAYEPHFEQYEQAPYHGGEHYDLSPFDDVKLKGNLYPQKEHRGLPEFPHFGPGPEVEPHFRPEREPHFGPEAEPHFPAREHVPIFPHHPVAHDPYDEMPYLPPPPGFLEVTRNAAFHFDVPKLGAKVAYRPPELIYDAMHGGGGNRKADHTADDQMVVENGVFAGTREAAAQKKKKERRPSMKNFRPPLSEEDAGSEFRPISPPPPPQQPQMMQQPPAQLVRVNKEPEEVIFTRVDNGDVADAIPDELVAPPEGFFQQQERLGADSPKRADNFVGETFEGLGPIEDIVAEAVREVAAEQEDEAENEVPVYVPKSPNEYDHEPAPRKNKKDHMRMHLKKRPHGRRPPQLLQHPRPPHRHQPQNAFNIFKKAPWGFEKKTRPVPKQRPPHPPPRAYNQRQFERRREPVGPAPPPQPARSPDPQPQFLEFDPMDSFGLDDEDVGPAAAVNRRVGGIGVAEVPPPAAAAGEVNGDEVLEDLSAFSFGRREGGRLPPPPVEADRRHGGRSIDVFGAVAGNGAAVVGPGPALGGHAEADVPHQFVQVEAHDRFRTGHDRGNGHHRIQDVTKRDGPTHAEQVSWSDSHGGYGRHYYEYNHNHHDYKGGKGHHGGKQRHPAAHLVARYH